MEKKRTMYLPSELIAEILLRLPVKFLIRYKSVCKSWFNLISNPNFANSHFHSFSESTRTRRILSISLPGLLPQIRSIDFQALLNNHSNSNLLNPNLSLPQSYFPFKIKGSCRGFLFLHSYSSNYIWNPSTGFHMKIPLSPIRSNIGIYLSYLHGFGYDHSRDDYLLVLLSINPVLDDNNISSNLDFFSLRDNAWKQIRGLPYWSPYRNYPKEGFLFNGAIHWFVSRRRSLKMLIVAFDLMERKLLEIPLPDGFGCFLPDMGLWVFGEFLSLWVMMNGIVQIWVMKEYKVHSSWTKTLVFPIDADTIHYFSPIYSKKDGDIIGTIGGTGLVKYNGIGQLLGHCFYCDDPHGSEVVMYTESLLSLPGWHKQLGWLHL